METKHSDSSDKCEEEDRLVEQLKLACDTNNKEVDLKKSSQALHGMAKLYAANTEHKKFSYIRSAALFNAAIIRDKENKEIKKNLDSLCITALKVARAEIENENLFEFSKEVKQKLESYRNRLKTVELPLIADNVEGEELVALQKQKIDSVKIMQDDVTAIYTELMRYVSDKCENIMGKPPCKFTVVGMGSLARAQITLYSDFEHVIVLDDKVENMNKQEREKVMRYFRWFTTIFHIIVINLGETIIPAVAIPTLNGEKEDCFFDSITPRGISFDGMMPHASKIPLGRQQLTKGKPWKTELIKPVAEMLKYLDSEVDMKEGYHLADILSKTCYVAGDQSLYKDFEQKANLIVVENDKSSEFKQVKEQINEDLHTFMMRHQVEFLSFAATENNIKRLIYRNATLFIAALGRIHHIPEASCFDILDKLKDIGFFDEETTHKLKFMVAVALEIRFKMYMKSGKQDDAISVIDDKDMETLVTNLVALVGKESLIQFVTTTTQLTEDFWSADFGSLNNIMITLTTRILTLSMLTMEEEFEKKCQKFAEDKTNITKETFDIVLKFIRDVLRYTTMFENNPFVGFNIAQNTLEYCKKEEEEFVAKAFMFYFLVRMDGLGIIGLADKVKMLNNRLQVILKGSGLICKKKHKSKFHDCWWAMFSYASALAGLKQHELAIDVFRSLSQLNRLNSDYTNNWDCFYMFLFQAITMLNFKEFSEAKSVLNQLLSIQGIMANRVKPFCYFLLAKCHFGLKNYLESFICNVHGIRVCIANGLELETGIRENTFVTFHFLKRFISGEESNEELDAQWRILLDDMCGDASDDTSDDTSDYTSDDD